MMKNTLTLAFMLWLAGFCHQAMAQSVTIYASDGTKKAYRIARIDSIVFDHSAANGAAVAPPIVMRQTALTQKGLRDKINRRDMENKSKTHVKPLRMGKPADETTVVRPVKK